MDSQDFIQYRKEMKRIKIRTSLLLIFTAAAMIALFLAGGLSLSPQEKRLYSSVLNAQSEIVRFREESGKEIDETVDTHRTGLIGIEWSPISTTLGDIPSKRTSCDPRWSIYVSRTLDKLGFKRGDRIVVLSSSSFPGMILNVLTALEARGADITLILSLGSSTWGANDPEMTWPKIAARLRERGMLRTKEKYLTLGGGRERGNGLSEEGIAIMKEIAESEKTPLIVKGGLAEMIDWKMDLIEEINPKAVISIGGSHSSLGDNDAIIALSPGLHRKPDKNAGNGVIAKSLQAGYPVIHFLNMRELSAKSGIPFDSAPRPVMQGTKSVICAIAGLAIFAAALFTFKRWKMIR